MKDCKNCKDRHPGCQDTCTTYVANILVSIGNKAEIQKKSDIYFVPSRGKNTQRRPKAFKRKSIGGSKYEE